MNRIGNFIGKLRIATTLILILCSNYIQNRFSFIPPPDVWPHLFRLAAILTAAEEQLYPSVYTKSPSPKSVVELSTRSARAQDEPYVFCNHKTTVSAGMVHQNCPIKYDNPSIPLKYFIIGSVPRIFLGNKLSSKLAPAV